MILGGRHVSKYYACAAESGFVSELQWLICNIDSGKSESCSTEFLCCYGLVAGKRNQEHREWLSDGMEFAHDLALKPSLYMFQYYWLSLLALRFSKPG